MSAVGDFYLEVNNVPLDTHAWRCLSYDDLLNGPAVRGEDIIMPSAVGRRPKPRRIDALVVSLSMLVDGSVDEDGDALTMLPLEGVLSHRDYLVAELGLGSEVDDGTVPATFYRGDLNPLAGDVTVLAITDWRVMGGTHASFRLDLSIPDGALVATGS